MSARTIEVPNWPRPRGYANGMAAHGELLAIAGQIGWDRSETIVSDDFTAQFEQSLRNVAAVVEAAGGKPSDIVSLTIFVTDKRAYLDAAKAVGAAWRNVLGKHFPAMALVEVTALVESRAQVEVQGLAVLSPTPAGEPT